MTVGIRCLFLGLFCVVACQRPTPEPTPKPVAKESAAPAAKGGDGKASKDWKERMHYQLEVATELRRAVILADLDNARALAKRIGDLPAPEGLPDAWTADFEALRAAGKMTAAAETPSEIARGVATVARACGGCHASQGVEPSFGPPEPPPNRDDLESEMRRYQWAIERMWEAMLGGSDERWSAGAQALQAPSEKKLDERSTQTAEITSTMEAMHAIAEARGETDPVKRLETLGVALSACVTCHTAVGLARGE
jgi:mono/diheme cytochrome c family protein